MASSSHHPSYPGGASQSQTPISPGINGEEGEKPRLTKEQKKSNHIQSERAGKEQKRRLAIREAYDNLCSQVPGLEGQARSEGVVLNGIVDYVRKLMLERQRMIVECEAKGLEVPPGVREGLANMPLGFLDGPAPGEGREDREGSSVSPGRKGSAGKGE
ncbi:hypothetical protein QBC40DRAFT_306048 [Triangularia verruculosa]|uniref:BHLH domain-containing protein n=1 Tax=Triangularia verruculosa TaxID=2587418 RepID=A0AAN6XIS4_9PEZI|nr:hypothetical protein QBC40DRAFT_306048 [Triangularia verruculosa]